MKIFDKLITAAAKRLASDIVTELDGREKTEERIKQQILADRAANQLHWANIYRNAISAAAQSSTTIGGVVEASNAVCDRMEAEANGYKAKNNL